MRFGRACRMLSHMRSRFLLPFALAAAPAVVAAQRTDRADHHQFEIANFRTESGVVLPRALVVYGTYGHLNAARDNAVLIGNDVKSRKMPS